MNANRIATLKWELDELLRKSNEIEAKMNTVDRERSNAKRRVCMLTHHQADSQRIDDATRELESLEHSYNSLNGDYWKILDETRMKNRELSELTQRESIDIVARTGGFRR